MSEQIWHIAKVKGGMELAAHEVLAKAGFELFTPFETRYLSERGRKARGRGRRVAYAEPVIKGYLFLQVDEGKYLDFATIASEKHFLYGLMGRAEKLAFFPDAHLSGLREVYRDGYDHKRDSRKNRAKKYAQAVVLPKFTEGQRAKFIAGGFAGLVCEVKAFDEHTLRAQVEQVLFGVPRIVTVDAYDLEDAA